MPGTGITDGSGADSDGRVSSSMTTKFPEDLDINDGITTQGTADDFKVQYNSALRTRGLLASLLTSLPTVEELMASGLSNIDAQEAHDEMEVKRQAT